MTGPSDTDTAHHHGPAPDDPPGSPVATFDWPLLRRAFTIWFVLLLLAIAMGTVRRTWLMPRLGTEMARLVGTLLFLAALLWVIWRSVEWICPSLERRLLSRIGIFWVALTASFEFAFQHWVLGVPWRVLLADYNIFEGRLWVLVLLAELVGPAILGGMRRRSARAG